MANERSPLAHQTRGERTARTVDDVCQPWHRDTIDAPVQLQDRPPARPSMRTGRMIVRNPCGPDAPDDR